MKKLIFVVVFVVFSVFAFSQAVQPSLMVVPSNNWMHNNKFETIVTKANGKEVATYDYAKAYRENNELGQATHKIGEMMQERGFQLKDMQAELNSQALEDALDGASDYDMEESAYDKIMSSAGPDIAMHINWWTEVQGPRKTMYFDLTAFDAYTNKQIASASGHSDPQMGVPEMVMLETSVLKYIDDFNNQLQQHFEDMMDKGREISVRFNVMSGWEDGLETEVEGVELTEYIEKWMMKNCVNSRCHQKSASEKSMYYDSARIPLFSEDGTPYQAKQWLNQLRKELKKKGVPSKIQMRGLGQAQLILGEQ